MIPLSIDEINKTSPYKVNCGSHSNFGFLTTDNIIYDISFMEDMEIAGCQTYQFSIRRITDDYKGYDPKVKDTILAILEEFFNKNQYILLYICDDTDGREAVRNRLFVRWFEEYDNNKRFTIKTANAIVEGKGFYTAIIVENNHPQLHDITQEFDDVASTLTAK